MTDLIDWQAMTLFLYILARVSGCIALNPILGRRGTPAMWRAGMILAFSVFVASFTEQPVTVPTLPVELMVRVVLEFGIGFVLGMAMNFFFYIPQLAGDIIDIQMGMTMAQTYDPSSQTNLTVTANLLNILMTLLFLACNGHHTLLRIMLTSGQIVPFGEVALGTQLSARMLELFVECTILAVKLAMPVLAAELLGQVGAGILMRVIPQINIFVINIDLKVIIGLLLLLFLMMPFSEFLLQAEASMLNYMAQLLHLM